MITKAIHGDTKTNNKNINEDFEADMMNGFPWPPRCYICSFCKREFKSAQVLGGHMNIHRKDRARLRTSPISHYTQSTILNLNLNPNLNHNPNPNPSFLSSSSSAPFSTRQLFSPLNPTSFSSRPPWLSPCSYHPSPTFYHPSPTFSSPYASSSYYQNHENVRRFVGGDLRSLNRSGETRINSKAEEVGCMMRLDLEIGVLGCNSSKDDIDLVLRLGY